ncbi:MAG: hypothetical protein KAU48_05875, partial [Candidatus Thorarchaeota archaeon]|nr:hypothetical protein [Candidatus Thorarchaeota archaeon]
RDLGDNNEITLESAKKVVAQFGAPGEVADEYRYSMLPETIPEEDIPTEIVRETGKIDRKQQAKEPEKTPPRELGVDPTTRYSTFFFKSFALTVMWAGIVFVLTFMSGPMWSPLWFTYWPLIFISIEVTFVTIILLARSLYLKRKKVILWKRSYPDWSILQILVTLPENAVKDTGSKLKHLDIAASFVGVLLCIPMLLVWNHPWFILIGIPAIILLILRMKIIVRKLDKEKDPYEKSRLEFGINFSLLVVLDSSINWLFNMTLPWNMLIWFVTPLLAIFVPLFGTVLLLQVLTGAQNLWWKTDDQKTQTEKQSNEDIRLRKEAIKKGMGRNGVMMFVKMSGWLLIFNSLIIYVSSVIPPGHYMGIFNNMMILFFETVILIGVLVTLYFLFRNFRIGYLNSSTLIGRRTRLEAVIDLSLSSVLAVAFIGITSVRYSSYSIEDTILYYYEVFGIQFGRMVMGIELSSVLLVIIGLMIRIIGNILEFKSEYKISAAKRIEESGLLVLVAVSFIVGGEFIKYLATHDSFIIYYTYYLTYLIIAIFVAFQVISSGMKVKEMTNASTPMRTDEYKNINEFSEHARIAN